MKSRILILGACGQIGTELTAALREKYGKHKVVASDIREGDADMMASGPFEIIDATNYEAVENIVIHYEINEVYLMAAMLSATAEKFPAKGWHLNMTSLFNVLNLAKDKKIEKVFWPSSIAVFGPTTPRVNTPQHTIMEPSTVYGISKQTGERWCEYYFHKYGVDVRSIRYPGIISWQTLPGGGTTDYAIDIYHKALKHNKYLCFLNAESTLPMIYMEDAIRATLDIMAAPAEKIKIRSSYNLAAISFNPEEIAASIKKQRPEFAIAYEPDFRQEIADSWPQSILDTEAQEDWGWKHQFDLDAITEEMLKNLEKTYKK
ncbi:MAG: NAD-dependent epimerase [Flavobacteriaceae bacterium CG_4_8_14_3_um_filter_34_10]|nr:NAD-dependent epimerase/dehydratase family protein [Flavobacteriia bacterium]OIP50495.1 MAG: NAD-dependent epimerase [Flavobacteriaceae bacterium CG2_30_34_30]PIQ17526.1 MAG: NAD-dependent epimerase [Flavobacteriaceae bacterium CG18_big_fil_WC_8_21_14_2_50_34_36]PIV48437.1 MAG: NAD-dependent epimerase [Flavobacteriaceae bacterium CG02_land_8_20_14_3_00_34_13]PIX09352.1 MAG: NAD-dependent epimerase [Flavobacteriaceae bacterium CG_4_8_14_3_um_filter_34_10]PIZ08072.1 MAG: NAD-dependent epimera